VPAAAEVTASVGHFALGSILGRAAGATGTAGLAFSGHRPSGQSLRTAGIGCGQVLAWVVVVVVVQDEQLDAEYPENVWTPTARTRILAKKLRTGPRPRNPASDTAGRSKRHTRANSSTRT
jgi:hypothetical protein